MLYVDDGAFAFISRYDLEIGSKLVYETFAKFGVIYPVTSTHSTSTRLRSEERRVDVTG